MFALVPQTRVTAPLHLCTSVRCSKWPTAICGLHHFEVGLRKGQKRRHISYRSFPAPKRFAQADDLQAAIKMFDLIVKRIRVELGDSVQSFSLQASKKAFATCSGLMPVYCAYCASKSLDSSWVGNMDRGCAAMENRNRGCPKGQNSGNASDDYGFCFCPCHKFQCSFMRVKVEPPAEAPLATAAAVTVFASAAGTAERNGAEIAPAMIAVV